jgi:hypothetical protein
MSSWPTQCPNIILWKVILRPNIMLSVLFQWSHIMLSRPIQFSNEMFAKFMQCPNIMLSKVILSQYNAIQTHYMPQYNAIQLICPNTMISRYVLWPKSRYRGRFLNRKWIIKPSDLQQESCWRGPHWKHSALVNVPMVRYGVRRGFAYLPWGSDSETDEPQVPIRWPLRRPSAPQFWKRDGPLLRGHVWQDWEPHNYRGSVLCTNVFLLLVLSDVTQILKDLFYIFNDMFGHNLSCSYTPQHKHSRVFNVKSQLIFSIMSKQLSSGNIQSFDAHKCTYVFPGLSKLPHIDLFEMCIDHFSVYTNVCSL